MKRNTFLHATTLTVIVVIALAACQARAATSLSNPMGMTVDANGNLYVANLAQAPSTGSILVYNPKYVQQTARTITTGIDLPTGVAFDSQGNLYVANLGNSSITRYNGAGYMDASPITSNIDRPLGVAVDSLDDVWVNNAGNYLSVYSPFGSQIDTWTPGARIDSIATQGEWFVVGKDTTWSQPPAGEFLTNKGTTGERQFPSHYEAVAATFNSAGNYYMAQATGEVDIINPATGSRIFLLMATYPPGGIAVDSKRGHLFLSNSIGNTIDVYTTKGVYLTTIH